MSIDITGTSVKGRQVLTSSDIVGASDVTLLLTQASQNQYRYKGFLALEDASYGIDAFTEGKKIYWRGAQLFFPSGLAYTQRVVAYWAVASVAWRLIVTT